MTLKFEEKVKTTYRLSSYLVLLSMLFVLTHLINEITDEGVNPNSLLDTTVILLLILSSYLIFVSNLKESTNALSVIKTGNEEIAILEKRNRFLKEELTNRILEQFKAWGLSSAESEIALLLIKGFSSQEIASLRGSSDRTVRKQATEIYRKTNQIGRAALSAFFIEDLL